MKKLMIALAVFAAAFVVVADTITVTSTADEFPVKDGVFDPDQLTQGTLRWALANAQDGDTITFDASLAGQTITIKGIEDVRKDTSLLVDKGVSIVGPAGGITIDSTFKDGSRDHGGRLFNVPAGVASKVTFSGIRFYRGNGRGWSVVDNKNFPGGACYVGSPVKFENCVFDECRNGYPAYHTKGVDNGGGAILAAAHLELDGCEFTGCGLDGGNNWGGAIMLAGKDGSPLKFVAKDTTFVNCYSLSHGGALWIHTGVSSATFTRCLFVRCETRGDNLRGGAIYADPTAGSVIRFDSCSFRENSLGNSLGVDGFGGAIYACRGKWIFNRCEFYRNVAYACGGALALRDGSNGEPECLAVNSTFCQNWCGSHGGAADVRNGSCFVNCTFVGNRICNSVNCTASASIYSENACSLLNCCSVYAANVNGWFSGSTTTPVSTGNYSGLAGGSKPVNCLTSNYTPVIDLDNAEQLAAMSKLFTGYEYWVYPIPQWKSSYKEVEYWSPANEKVTTPTITDDQNHPERPRVCGIEKGGPLDGTGYPVKVNADYTHICYSVDGGVSWTDLYTSGTPDDSTLALISADQRGVPYYKGKTPIGAATYVETSDSGLLIVVR